MQSIVSGSYSGRSVYRGGYGKAGPAIYELIRKTAKQEGLFLDPVYSAKAFQGMLTRIKEGAVSADHVIFVHTGALWHDGACARIVSGVGEPKLDV